VPGCPAFLESHPPLGCPAPRAFCEGRVSLVTAKLVFHLYYHSMPSRLKRYYGGGDIHFITCSCYRRQPWLGTPEHRDLFLKILEETRIRYRFVVLGYVVMPEHFHILMSEPQIGNPSKVMQLVKQRFAQHALAVKDNTGTGQEILPRRAAPIHVWEARFYDFNIWTEKKRIEKLKYIHRNPVRRGLVSSPQDWHWSSFRYYLSGDPGLLAVNETSLMRLGVRVPIV
jgi:REP-associated tyrosine transposase